MSPAPIRDAVRFRLRRNAYLRLLSHAGVRPQDIAVALDVSPSTVSRWTHGTLCVRGAHALRLAALLNASFPELFETVGP